MTVCPGFQHPLTMSMWDYSWLLRGHPGVALDELPKCVEEAAERGYNTLRVVVFPHHYREPEHHFQALSENRRPRNYGRMLDIAHAYAGSALARTILPSGKRLAAVVHEADGPCNFPDHPDAGWGVCRLWTADAPASSPAAVTRTSHSPTRPNHLSPCGAIPPST